jgi:hypothetical protein
MMKKDRWSCTKWLIGAVTHGLAWVIGYFLLALFFSDSPCRSAYGLLSGWYLALYVDFIANVSLGASLLAALFFYGLLVVAMAQGWQWFFHDASAKLSGVDYLLAIVPALGFTSPILLNAFVRYAMARLARLSKKDSDGRLLKQKGDK